MYNIPFIVINNRDISIDDIRGNRAQATTPFEQSSFDFIRAWLSGQDTFTITTSGSTGDAKPISITRTQMRQSAALTIKALGLDKDAIAFVCLNTHYIAGKMMLVRALEAGMRIVACEPSSTPLAQTTKAVDFVAMVPLQVEETLEGNQVSKLDTMKAIIIGGAAISDTLESSIQKIKAPVYATYGMTETISHIALRRLNGGSASPYFTTLPGIDILLDERGCLVISAPYIPETIVTNDLVEILDGNKFRWLGRWDNIINSGGIKVVPEKIEIEIGKIFNRLGVQQNFFVYGIPDDRLGSKIILVVEGEFFVKKNDVFDALSQTFSKYEIPKEIISIQNFFYTPTGKINRKKTLNLS